MNVFAEEIAFHSIVKGGELTHGTLESHDLPVSRGFFEDVLRLRCVQHAPVAQMVAGCAEFAMACVKAGDKLSPQGMENRWVLSVDSAETVAEIHNAAVSSEFTRQVGEITKNDGFTSFIVQDGDSNWWEVTDFPDTVYQSYFERGDID